MPGMLFLGALLFCLAGARAQAPLSITIVSTTNTTCGYDNGIIVAQGSGGTPPYSYQSYGAQQSNTSGVFSQLPEVALFFGPAYDITVYDATGAKATVSVSLTNNHLNPTVLPSTVVNPSGCATADGKITMNVTGGLAPYSYSMDDGASFQSSNVFPNLSPGYYQILVKDANGCISAPWSPGGSYINYQNYNSGGAQGELLQNPSCSLQFYTLSSGEACGNDGNIEVTLPAGAPDTYQFSLNNAPFAPLTQDGYYFIPPGLYTIAIKDLNTGLINSITQYMHKNCLLAATSTDAVCGESNGSVTVTAGTANGIAPFTYSIDGVNFQSGLTFSELKAGTYTLIAKDAGGATSSVQVTVAGGCPTMTFVVAAAHCANSDGMITVTPSGGAGAPYSYSVDGGLWGPNPVLSGLAAGTHSVSLKDASGNANMVSVVVPDDCIGVDVDTKTATCGNSNGQLTVTASNGTAPYTYSIDGVNFQASNVFTGLPGQTYTVTVKDNNNLTGTASVQIGDIPGPQISATTTAASCLNNDGGITATAIGGTAPFQYSINGGASQATGSFTGVQSGPATVAIEDVNGCTVSTTVTVVVIPDISVDLQDPSPICEGTGVKLQATSNGTGFSWSPATGLSDPTILNPTASPDVSQDYTLTVTRGVCTGTVETIVEVNPAPVADAGKNISICYGKSAELQGSGQASGSAAGGGLSYSWTPSTGLDNPAISNPTVEDPAQSLTYNLTVTDANGCVSLNTAGVTVGVTPPGVLFAGDDTSVMVNGQLQLNAVDVNNSGFVQYQWTPADGLNNAYIEDPVATIGSTITYAVVAKTADGCEGKGSITIQAYAFADIFVPSAFSPNNDGHNDILRARAQGIREFKYFNVYDRWGNLVFSTKNPSEGWDGRYKGQAPEAGTFVWMTMGVDYNGRVIQHKGTVILVK